MKGKRFSEAQIMRILHEAESLDSVREGCRQHTMAEQPLYRWRRPCGGREGAQAQRRRALARENAALKRPGGERTLDKRMLKEVGGKNGCAWLRSAKPPRIWSRRTSSASAAPVGSWRS